MFRMLKKGVLSGLAAGDKNCIQPNKSEHMSFGEVHKFKYIISPYVPTTAHFEQNFSDIAKILSALSFTRPRGG